MGRNFRTFEKILETLSFFQTTDPADPVYVLITQGLFSNAALASFVNLFKRILKNIS